MSQDLLRHRRQQDAEHQAVVEMDAVLHDAGYSAAQPVLEQLRGIAALDAPLASVPTLRARVLLDRLDDDGAGVLLGELLGAALSALDSPHVEADAALVLYEAVRRAVERGEIRAAGAARTALQHRCEHCSRDAWWLVDAYVAVDGLAHGRHVGAQAACRTHVDDVERHLAERHAGRVTSFQRAMLPGNARYPKTAPPATAVSPSAARSTPDPAA